MTAIETRRQKQLEFFENGTRKEGAIQRKTSKKKKKNYKGGLVSDNNGIGRYEHT